MASLPPMRHAPAPAAAIISNGHPDSSFRIQTDSERNLVLVTGHGVWTAPMMDAHFDELGILLDGIRARGHQIRVLVDLTQAPEQSPEVMARIGAGKARIYASEDRVALIVSSSRGKIQMRNAHDAPNHGLFLSMNAAMTWLFAWG